MSHNLPDYLVPDMLEGGLPVSLPQSYREPKTAEGRRWKAMLNDPAQFEHFLDHYKDKAHLNER